jgi:hypothetical protein
MVSKEDVGTNLKACFGALIADQPYYGDWCLLGSFLSNTEAVLSAMAELDKAMWERLCVKRLKGTVDRVTDREMVTSAYHDYCGSYKGGLKKTAVVSGKVTIDKTVVSRLLSEVLTKFEKSKAFEFETGDFQATVSLDDRTTTSNPKRHAPTYHGFVQPTAFNKQLVKRSHWKDPGALLIHGEFTHRIQWYAVASQLFADGDHAARVFASIGAYVGSYARPLPGQGPTHLYLWDALCDRTNKKDVSFDDDLFATEDAGDRGRDFRSPENLNAFLVANEGHSEWRWPLLRDFLTARYSKRDYEVERAKADAKSYLGGEDQWPIAFQLQYLCRKLYNLSVWDLPEEDSKYKKLVDLASDRSDQILKL